MHNIFINKNANEDGNSKRKSRNCKIRSLYFSNNCVQERGGGWEFKLDQISFKRNVKPSRKNFIKEKYMNSQLSVRFFKEWQYNIQSLK